MNVGGGGFQVFPNVASEASTLELNTCPLVPFDGSQLALTSHLNENFKAI